MRRSTQASGWLAPVHVHTSVSSLARVSADDTAVWAAVTQSSTSSSVVGRTGCSMAWTPSSVVMPSDTMRPQKFQTPAEMPGEITEIPARTRWHRMLESVVGNDLEEPDPIGAQVCVRVVGECGRRCRRGVGHVGDGSPAGSEPTRRASVHGHMSDLSFTHLDPLGRARMVDVTPKEPTHRRAVARCKVFMKPETTAAIANREVKKGDVLSVARVAGIQAAKRTSDMIPLCHPLLVGAVSINFEIGDDFVAIECHVDTVDRTGVEMEALHACSTAALTVYDMCKSADRGMVIGELALWEKTGGRSGVYRRSDGAAGDTLDGAST